VLTFIGAKMLVAVVGIKIETWISLAFVAVVLLGSVAASLLFTKEDEQNIKVDLPPDFDLPLSEECPPMDDDCEDEVFKPTLDEGKGETVESPK
jgi:hypothetical protein